MSSSASKAQSDLDSTGVAIACSMYEAQRAYAGSIIGHIGNATIAGIAYIAATSGLFLTTNSSGSAWWLLLIPLPAWGMFLYQLHLGSIVVASTQTLLRLEQLFSRSLQGHAPKLGQNAEERLTNMHVQPWSLKVGGVLAFAVEPFILTAFTVASLFKFARDSTGGYLLGAVAWLIYAILAIACIVQFVDQARRLKGTAEMLL